NGDRLFTTRTKGSSAGKFVFDVEHLLAVGAAKLDAHEWLRRTEETRTEDRLSCFPQLRSGSRTRPLSACSTRFSDLSRPSAASSFSQRSIPSRSASTISLSRT